VDPALYSTSTIAAFLGGVIALAAPCCVTFLLPAYLASAFKARRALVAMTLVFGLGVAAVLLPIILGVAALSRLVSQFHNEVFLLGGLMLVLLGVWSLAGKNMALPMHRTAAFADRPTVFSIFSLGVFSGAASSCCAPVLAGVLTLSAVSSSLPQAVGLGFAYVAGMVSPLVLMALLWEHFNLSNNVIVRGRPIAIRVGERQWRVHSSNLFAGVLFLAVGSLLIVSTFMGGLEAPQSQTRLGEWLRSVADTLVRGTTGVPDAAFVVLLAIATSLLALRALHWSRRRSSGESEPQHIHLPRSGKRASPPEEVTSVGRQLHEPIGGFEGE
jgi:cytochrome c-type biogenesis protein